MTSNPAPQVSRHVDGVGGGEKAEALIWIAAFAEMRAKDDSKTFARVNRAALRTIAEKARAALSQARSEQPPAGPSNHPSEDSTR
jgi:hypothetical protein